MLSKTQRLSGNEKISNFSKKAVVINGNISGFDKGD